MSLAQQQNMENAGETGDTAVVNQGTHAAAVPPSTPVSNSQVASSSMNYLPPSLSSLTSATRAVPKVSTKNVFSGSASDFPAWRTKQLAIFRSTKVAVVLTMARPLVGSADYDTWCELNIQLHDLLILNLDQQCLLLVRDCSESADGRTAWERICHHFESNTSISKSGLLTKLFNMKQFKSERPHVFALRVQEVAQQLEFVHGEKQPLCNLIVQVLKNLAPEYKTISSILTRQLDSLTFEATVQALRDEYEALHAGESGHRSADQAHMAEQVKKFNGKCHNCGKQGHKAADCRSKKRDKTNSNSGSSQRNGSGFACSYHKTNSHSDADCRTQQALRQGGLNTGSGTSIGGASAHQANTAMHVSYVASMPCIDPVACYANVDQNATVLRAIHLDSGASCDIIDPDLCSIKGVSAIYDVKPIPTQVIKVGGGTVEATHRGTIRVLARQGDLHDKGLLHIRDALLVKGLGVLLVSLVALEDRAGAQITRTSDGGRTLILNGGRFHVTTKGNVYRMLVRLMHAPQGASIMQTALAASASASATSTALAASAVPVTAAVWHQRLGHAAMRQVELAALRQPFLIMASTSKTRCSQGAVSHVPSASLNSCLIQHQQCLHEQMGHVNWS